MTRWRAPAQKVRRLAARVRPDGEKPTHLVHSCSLIADEKPDIVELDSGDELNAEERAQIKRIKEAAQKRRREREASPPPATPAKKPKPEVMTGAVAADKIRDMVCDGIAQAMAPLLDRLDHSDNNLGALHRRIATLEYAFPIYAPSLFFEVYK